MHSIKIRTNIERPLRLPPVPATLVQRLEKLYQKTWLSTLRINFPTKNHYMIIKNLYHGLDPTIYINQGFHKFSTFFQGFLLQSTLALEEQRKIKEKLLNLEEREARLGCRCRGRDKARAFIAEEEERLRISLPRKRGRERSSPTDFVAKEEGLGREQLDGERRGS